MLELVAAMDLARKATCSAMEEEPSVWARPVERSPRIRPTLATGLRRLAKAIDVPSAGRGGAKAPTTTS